MSDTISKNEISSNLPALTGGSGLTPAEIAEELGGDIPEYPRVKIPSGGAVNFEVPGDDPESPDAVKEIAGVVVWHHKTNAFWADANTQDTPPDCSSMDGETGVGAPGGNCAVCPMNQFGAGEGGRGKACKNMECLYILQDGAILPLALSLPPTSLRAWRNYKSMIVCKGKHICDLYTRITLTKKQNKDGQPYAVAAFRAGDQLPAAVAKKSYEYRQGVKAMLAAGYDAGAAVAPDQFVEVDENTGEVV